MRSFQRVIKYCAMAFAALLAVGIISGIASAAIAVISAVSGEFILDEDQELKDYSESYTNVKSLDIDNLTGEIIIKSGDNFRIEAENVTENFSSKVSSNGKWTIHEKKNNFNFLWFNFGGIQIKNTKITVFIPEDFVAKDVEIEIRAGRAVIEDIHAQYMNFSVGAGTLKGNKLSAEEVKIDGGVGSITLTEIIFRDVDVDCGVGNLEIEGELFGDNVIDCGVGKVDLELKGNVDDYNLDIDAGVGKVRLNGERLSKTRQHSSKIDNSIKIDGGVGNVEINFY